MTIPPPPKPAKTPRFKMVFREPDLAVGHRVLIYGKPGCGKTTLMLRGLPRPLVAFDFDNSISILLQKPKEVSGIDPTGIYLADIDTDGEGRLDFGSFLTALRSATVLDANGRTRHLSDKWLGVKSTLIDTGTFAEHSIEPFIFEHPDRYPTQNAKKPKATSLADFAFRCGNIYKQDLYQLMLNYLYNIVSCHVHIGLVYHTAVGKTPNLESADGYALQYQPDSWVQGKTSLADSAMGWCDHVGFIKADAVLDTITVSENAGKVKEKAVERFTGNATISFSSTGDHIGKSRTLYGNAATINLADFDLSMLGIK